MNNEEDIPPELADLLSRMALPDTPLASAGSASGQLDLIRTWKRSQATAVVAGLQTDLRYHAHVIRLDWLQRLVIAQADGRKKVKRKDLSQMLNGGMSAAGVTLMEDGIEGFFVESVPTQRGDALIFEGHWEGAAQYTETVVRAFEGLPEDPLKSAALNTAYALLRLSTALVVRSGLHRRSLSAGEPKGVIAPPSDEVLQRLARRVRFTVSELETLGISLADLQPYILQPDQYAEVHRSPPGGSALDYFPLLEVDGGIIVASPGTMSLAVRATLLDTANRGGVGDALTSYMAEVQEGFAVSTGFFPGSELRLGPLDRHNLRATVIGIAPGRYLHVVQVLPDLVQFAMGGFGGRAALKPGTDAAIVDEVTRFWTFLASQPDNRESLTVILLSGWGGTIAVNPQIDENIAPSTWQFIPVSFADAATMGACEDGKLRDLRRICDQLIILEQAGYQVQSMNGSINLFGNWRTTGGNFVPEHWDADPPAFLYLPLDDLLKVRAEGEENRDVRSVPRPDGTFEVVQRSEWGQHAPLKPIYGSFRAIAEGRLAGVITLQDRTWWVEAVAASESRAVRKWQYQIWNSVLQWLGASAAGLISAFGAELAPASCEVRVVLSGVGEPEFGDEEPTGAPLDHIVLTQAPDGVREVQINQGWLYFLKRAENHAELALATAVVMQIAAASGGNLSVEDIEAQIRIAIPSTDWRYLHAQKVKYPLDRLAALGIFPQFRRIPKSAASLVRCGTVWRFWDRTKGRELNDEEQCRDFLTAYYDFILTELIDQIRLFNREALLKLAATRYVSARLEHDLWKRTIRAMRSIHGSEIDADALQRISEFNAVQRAAKTICEIGACEATAEGGAKPAHEDLDEMFARALLIFGNGQLYATIRGGLVKPHLKISPAGDLLSDRSVFEKTFVPSSQRAHTKALNEASNDYLTRFEPDEKQPEDLPWSAEFKNAVSAEFNCSPEAFVDLQLALIQLCESLGKGILVMRRSELASSVTANEQFPDCNISLLLERLTLPRRDDWKARPEEYSNRDLELWRFDRRYSLINRPLLAITSDPDPMLVVSPAFVSDATVYQVGGMHYATVHNDVFWDSKEASAYAGQRAKEIGAEFEDKVASVLNNVGFVARPRQKVTALLEDAVEGDLGDVDVFAIAPTRTDVFVIEAKNLKLCRTEAEVAARMTDYAGKMRQDSKGREKPDKLLRHIRRVQYLRENAQRLWKRLGLPEQPRIHGLMVVDAPQPMNFYMLEETPDAHSCPLGDLIETANRMMQDQDSIANTAI
ncbi:hypothetical protein [Inquilinus sp. CAU 1745]|uniref:hypothetical protein n=1 Tax=Inquilinus sp. CAU 1745 TaxID=3140369 RepID=UPI00325C14ED